MVKFNINIAHTYENEVFVQTNFVNRKGELKNMGDYAQITMSEEDAIELARILSNVCETEFVDKDYHCTVFTDEKVIKEYDSE